MVPVVAPQDKTAGIRPMELADLDTNESQDRHPVPPTRPPSRAARPASRTGERRAPQPTGEEARPRAGNAVTVEKPTSTQRALQVRQMFGRIVGRYDLLNRLMSLGMDRRWRQLAAAAARPAGARCLDVGTGTGDLAFELVRQGAAAVVGADFTPQMLALARAKAARRSGVHVQWIQADVERLPFRDGAFDSVTNAFVLRNLADLRLGLSEMARVLKPGGQLACLDMTHPRPGPFAALYRLYFNRLLPPISGAISGDRGAYRYLPNSLRNYPDAPTLAQMLENAGLTDVRVERLGGGAVALHTGRKPPAGSSG